MVGVVGYTWYSIRRGLRVHRTQSSRVGSTAGCEVTEANDSGKGEGTGIVEEEKWRCAGHGATLEC